MMTDDWHKSQRLRPSLRNCQHIHTKCVLQLCFFIQQIDEILCISSFAQLQHNADSLFGGLVCDIHDIICFLGLHETVYIIQKFSDVRTDHRIWDLSDNNALFSTFDLLHFHFSTDFDLTHTGGIDLDQIVLIGNNSSCREIRPRNIFHHLLGIDQVLGTAKGYERYFHGVYLTLRLLNLSVSSST